MHKIFVVHQLVAHFLYLQYVSNIGIHQKSYIKDLAIS